MKTPVVQDVLESLKESLGQISSLVSENPDRYSELSSILTKFGEDMNLLVGFIPKEPGDPCTRCNGKGIEPGT